jgi:hypothetical protein
MRSLIAVLAFIALCGDAGAGRMTLLGSGPAGSVLALDLSVQGWGTTENPVGTATLNYSTVVGGSAPAAGDLVVYCVALQPEPVTWALPSGWTLVGSEIAAAVNEEHYCITKVIVAGDVSSPATPAVDATFTGGLWVAFRGNQAFTIEGTPDWFDQTLTSSDPAAVGMNKTVDVPPLVIVSIHKGYGLIATPLGATWGATTGTTSFSLITNDGLSEYAQTMIFKLYTASDAFGENISADQGDKGSSNYQGILAVEIQ